jgi:hypothetical protein
MNTTTYLARASAARKTVSDKAEQFVNVIRDTEIAAGRFDGMEASAYTLGYMQSFMIGQIAKLPAKYRDQIMAEMDGVIKYKLENV